MIYKTETGSTYQVDHIGKRVRRLNGVKNPTPRQGKDGEWKAFVSLNTDMVPGHLFFIWQIGKGTVTSRVIETIEEN